MVRASLLSTVAAVCLLSGGYGLGADREPTAQSVAQTSSALDGVLTITLASSDLSKPTIANVQFVQLVKLLDKTMLKFVDSEGNSYLVDPAQIVMVRTAAKK